jgi:hypothetical protein
MAEVDVNLKRAQALRKAVLARDLSVPAQEITIDTALENAT